MFIPCDKREGTCYFEFQFYKGGKTFKNTEFWAKDSLLINERDFNAFYGIYCNILDNALLSNGKLGFDYFGINYYDKKITEKILFELKKSTNEQNAVLIFWLEKAIVEYNGFYILGL